MRLRLLALCVGIALHSRLSELPMLLMTDYRSASRLAAILCGLSLLLAYAAGSLKTLLNSELNSQQTARLRDLLSYAWLTSAGFFWAMMLAQQQMHQRLPAALEGQDFWLVGEVASLVRGHTAAGTTGQDDSGNRRTRQFEFTVHSACLRLLPEQCAPDNQLMKGLLVTLSDYAALPLRTGERWQLRVRVNRPHGFSNPGGYDFEAAQFQRGIMARGYIRETALNKRLSKPRPGVNTWRAALAAHISGAGIAINKTLDHSGLLRALVIGDREGISDAQWDVFTGTGTNHLVVISGLHVGFMALAAFALINLLVRVSPALMLIMPAQHWAALAALLAALVYSLLAGFSLPTQRALIMISVLMGSRLAGWAIAPADSLLIAATLVLIKDPLAVTQAGFWLSFGAVASLFLAFSGHGLPSASERGWRQPLASAWQRWVYPQWVVSVGLLLPLILWTGQVSVISPLANVIAIPVVSLSVVPLVLLGSVAVAVGIPSASWLLVVADIALGWLMMFLEWLLSWTPGTWRPAVPSGEVMLLMALASILLLVPRGLVPRWMALLLLLPLFRAPEPLRPAPGLMWVHFLDVGQGLAIVVHTHRHTLVFDTGPALGPDYDAGQAVLLPYLRWRHVVDVDRVIISHAHADHSGGLASLLSEYPTPMQPMACESGQHWQWDGVDFRVLHPGNSARVSGNPNNSSCVLLIDSHGQRVLLTGDIEAEAERYLLSQWQDALSADIVQAPHHGSRSSSTPAFVAAVQARWVIISAGYNNRFDHPHPEIVSRYQQAGAAVEITAHTGALLFELGGTQPRLLERRRDSARRFWHNKR
jgi:competence protein ComEC